MRYLIGIIALVLVLGATACTSASGELKNRGFNTGQHYQLLNLKYADEKETEWSASGAYLFFIGGFGASGSTSIVGKIGFVIKINYEIVMIKMKSRDVRYFIDDSLKRPYVIYRHCDSDSLADESYGSVSTVNLIQDYCYTPELWLSTKDFNKDIQVLKYAG
jgi:hypothetical protein